MIYRGCVFGNSLIPGGFLFLFLKCHRGGLSLGFSVNEILIMTVKFLLLRKSTAVLILYKQNLKRFFFNVSQIFFYSVNVIRNNKMPPV